MNGSPVSPVPKLPADSLGWTDLGSVLAILTTLLAVSCAKDDRGREEMLLLP